MKGPGTQICAVLAAADPSGLYVLTLAGRPSGPLSLPAAPFDPARGQSFEARLREWASIHTAAQITHVEQIGARLSHGYIRICLLALVSDRNAFMPRGARWTPIADIFPWENWCDHEPEGLVQVLRPALYEWSKQARRKTSSLDREMLDVLFAGQAKNWKPALAGERFAVLYKAGLAPEAVRDSAGAAISMRQRHAAVYGQIMDAGDRQVLADTLSYLREKIAHHGIMPALLPGPFTLGALQKSVEAIVGVGLHTQNFRRDIVHSGQVIKTGQTGRTVSSLYKSRPGALWKWAKLAAHQGGMPLPRTPS